MGRVGLKFEVETYSLGVVGSNDTGVSSNAVVVVGVVDVVGISGVSGLIVGSRNGLGC